MKSIKAIDIDSLYKIATSEYVEYYNKAVAFKDFEFIHLMINEDYIYTTEQYLFLKEKWHTAIKDNMNITIDPRIAIILLAFFSYSIGFLLGRLSK